MKTFNESYIGEREDILQIVPLESKYILDIGCSIGALGESIKKRQQAEITGIELDKKMADIAQDKIDRVILGDVEELCLSDMLPKAYFDCIIFADSIEHFKNPWSVVEKIREFLKDDGCIVASIPNVRHISTICNLVFKGYWPYRERGIHDKTHLRFFCLSNIVEMFNSIGMRIVKLKRNYRIIEHPHRFNRYAKYFALTYIKDFLTFQYLILAKNVNNHE